jgi:REP element-mobilizing transposase RayT
VGAESKQDEAKGWHSRGYLPHFDSPEIVQHLVFRTADSLPAAVVAALPKDARVRFQQLDEALDLGRGERLLGQAGPASIVETAMLHFDGKRYGLIAWSVMPNHVHALLAQKDRVPLGGVVHSWKSFTAHEINKISARHGQFWAPDYFDRFIRTEAHFHKTIDYIEQNAVKARLVVDAADWRFSSARRRQD